MKRRRWEQFPLRRVVTARLGNKPDRRSLRDSVLMKSIMRKGFISTDQDNRQNAELILDIEWGEDEGDVVRRRR